MKNLIISPFALLALGCVAAAQAAPNATFLAIGYVPQVCAVQAPALLNTQPAVNIDGLSGQTLRITNLVNSETLATNAASFSIGFDAVCSMPHRLIIQSENNGLWRDVVTPAAPGFGDAVPYTAEVKWADNNSLLNADASLQQIKTLSINSTHPESGVIELDFAIQPGASNGRYFSPILAGTYRDAIRITVEPQ